MTREKTARKRTAHDTKNANLESSTRRVERGINEPEDWRSRILARVRTLIRRAAPHVIEEQKWKKPSNPAGIPVWSRDGIICTGETYKDKVKLTFAKGAALEDPSGLFNSSLAGNSRRAIDIREGDRIDEEAFEALVRAAVALNASRKSRE